MPSSDPKDRWNDTCLRLNIYVPHTANAYNTRAILVWFFGGGFVMGGAGEYGGAYLIKHDIIFITVNYRLGPYGFLCLDDASASGNQGLKDQIAALKWINENIGAFGGDASRITIAGESYGGGAVDLHLYSMYDTLFDKVIIQSGSIFADGFFTRPNYEAAIAIAGYLGHNVSTTKEALKVLANQDPLDVMEASRNLSLKLTACKEKEFEEVQNFINKDPFHLINLERIKSIRILIGYNSKEDFGSYANKPDEFYDSLGDIFYNNMNKNLVLEKDELRELSDTVKRFYLGGRTISLASMLDVSDFTSDFRINHAAELSVRRFIEQDALVYKYLFSYVGGSVYQNVTGVGAMHTEELNYLFEMGSQLNNDEQRLMRERMTMMWTNFVKFGKPVPQRTKLLPITWIPVNRTSKPYLNIDVNLTMQDSVYHERISFWDLFWHVYKTKSIIYDST